MSEGLARMMADETRRVEMFLREWEKRKRGGVRLDDGDYLVWLGEEDFCIRLVGSVVRIHPENWKWNTDNVLRAADLEKGSA